MLSRLWLLGFRSTLPLWYNLGINISVSHRVMMVAKKFLDAGKKLNFAVASRKTFSHELSDFGLESTAGEIPVVAIRTAKGEKFVMQEEFS